MACCIAVLYVWSLGWRCARWLAHGLRRVFGGPVPAGVGAGAGFAPPARRGIQLPGEPLRSPA